MCVCVRACVCVITADSHALFRSLRQLEEVVVEEGVGEEEEWEEEEEEEV